MFDKIIGKAKQTAEDFKEKAEGVSDKVADSVNKVLDDFNGATPSLKKAGYLLEEMEIEIGVPPKLIPRFSIYKSQDNLRDEAAEELKTNRVGKNILKGLNVARSLESKLRVRNMEFSHIEVEIGVVPTVKLRYRPLTPLNTSSPLDSEHK